MDDNNIIDQIRQIKYLRMKPEERFLYDILTKVKIKYCNKYIESIYLTLNDKILFEQDSKNKYFFVHYDEIWSVLINKYNVNYNDIQILIKRVVWDTLKLKVDTPSCMLTNHWSLVWDTLKLKVDTPVIGQYLLLE